MTTESSGSGNMIVTHHASKNTTQHTILYKNIKHP